MQKADIFSHPTYNGMPLRKQYLLVNSSDRSPNSRGTTDFFVQLREPLEGVVKVELSEVAIDYRIANVRSPANLVTVEGTDPFVPNGTVSVTIDEGQYTPGELRSALELQLNAAGVAVDVFLIGQLLRFDFLLPSAVSGPTDPTARFSIRVSSATLRAALGLTSVLTHSRFVQSIGGFGGGRLTFPRAVHLGGLAPYVMVQSLALGIGTKTSGGLGFWRLLLNDSANDRLTVPDGKCADPYLDEPRRLQEIDIRLAFPDGNLVDNRGGSISLLLEIVQDS